MATETTLDVGDIETAEAFRLVSSIHIGGVAAVNLVVGVAVAYLASTGALLRWALVELDAYLTTQELLRVGESVIVYATTVAVLVGLVLVALGLLAAASARDVHRKRNRRRSLAVCVANALNPLALPLAAIAATLLYLSDDESVPT